jgi:magnesium chelatase subunit H
VRRAVADMSVVESFQLENWFGREDTALIVHSWNVEKLGWLVSSSNIKAYDGQHLLGGLRVGNVWIEVQQPLGIVGDPMRLLLERDLKPHPQYAELYRWLENEFEADELIHMGVHGTVEWLPGSPLGSTAQSWPEIMLGNTPFLYIYARNNPSESSIAKRRGILTIVSHNVPLYGREGVYNELVQLKSFCTEWRDKPESKRRGFADIVLDQVFKAGLNSD